MAGENGHEPSETMASFPESYACHVPFSEADAVCNYCQLPATVVCTRCTTTMCLEHTARLWRPLCGACSYMVNTWRASGSQNHEDIEEDMCEEEENATNITSQASDRGGNSDQDGQGGEEREADAEAEAEAEATEGPKDLVKLTCLSKNANTDLAKGPKYLVQQSKTRARTRARLFWSMQKAKRRQRNQQR